MDFFGGRSKYYEKGRRAPAGEQEAGNCPRSKEMSGD
jgi:hypothetical protein